MVYHFASTKFSFNIAELFTFEYKINRLGTTKSCRNRRYLGLFKISQKFDFQYFDSVVNKKAHKVLHFLEKKRLNKMGTLQKYPFCDYKKCGSLGLRKYGLTSGVLKETFIKLGRHSVLTLTSSVE